MGSDCSTLTDYALAWREPMQRMGFGQRDQTHPASFDHYGSRPLKSTGRQGVSDMPASRFDNYNTDGTDETQ